MQLGVLMSKYKKLTDEESSLVVKWDSMNLLLNFMSSSLCLLWLQISLLPYNQFREVHDFFTHS